MGVRVRVADTKNDDKAPWWWRRRVGLTPFYFGAGAGLSALLSRLLSDTQVLVVLAILAMAAAWATHVRYTSKKDRAMRNFLWGVNTVFVLFVLASRFSLIDGGWTFIVLIGGVFGLGGFWWLDGWNRRRVMIERDVERWPALAEKLGMKQVKRGPMVKTETGRKWTFWWDDGDYTLTAFRGRARELESALGIPENRIRFEAVFVRDGLKSPNSIIVSENTESSILKEAVKFTSPTMRSICDPMFIGLREDGTKHEVVWYDPGFGGMHTLAAGSTGSGKSGLYHLVFAESAYCPDVIRWGIDAKGGMALRPWAPLMDWMVTDVETEAYWMLTALHNVLKKRSEYAASKGWGCWKPSAEHPVLVLFVDEAAEVFGLESFDMNSLSSSIARMGRAAGVLLLVATQHPTQEAIGSTQLSKNLRRRFCFSVEDDAAQRVVIPKSHGRFDASDIPIGKKYAGTYYSSEGGEICNLSGRVRFVTEHDVYRIVLEVGAENSPTAVPDLDEMSQQAAREASVDPDSGECYYDSRRIWTVHDAISPDGWTDENAEEDMAVRGGSGAPVQMIPAAQPVVPAHEPVHAPALTMVKPATGAPAQSQVHEPPVAARRLPTGAPVHIPAEVLAATHDPNRQVSDAPDPDAPPPWSEGDPPMLLDELVAPRSAAEAEEIERRIAEFALKYRESNVTPEEAQRMLDRMLDEAGPDGLTIGEMREVLGRSPSWYSEKLRTQLLAKPPTVDRVGTYGYKRAGARLVVLHGAQLPEAASNLPEVASR